MSTRVTIPLTERATELLRDRRLVPARTQGEWVSQLIEDAAEQLRANLQARLESELAEEAISNVIVKT